MQIIRLTPSQPIITGLLNSDDAIVLCDTSLASFVLNIPICKSSKNRQLFIKNIGSNDLTIEFNLNSQLFVTTGNISEVTLSHDEVLHIVSELKTGFWYQLNN